MNFSKKLRGFTLVEMLIVIVIIGVLASALIPRLTSVRGRANDTARRVALVQLTEGISVYNMDFNKLPGLTNTMISGAQGVSNLSGTLGDTISPRPTESKDGWTMPEYGITGDYAYVVAKRGSVDSGGFFMVARVETVGGANRVAISGAAPVINNTQDVLNFKPCGSISKGATASAPTYGLSGDYDCIYKYEDELRFVTPR